MMSLDGFGPLPSFPIPITPIWVETTTQSIGLRREGEEIAASNSSGEHHILDHIQVAEARVALFKTFIRSLADWMDCTYVRSIFSLL